MCWNPEVSLSTFVLGVAGILIGYINGLNDWRWSAFYISVASMQLLEFFVWSYGLRNRQTNTILSMIGLLLIGLQPVCAGLLLKSRIHQLVFYGLYMLFIAMYLSNTHPITFRTSIAKNGHLNWEWLQPQSWLIVIWTLFILIPIWVVSPNKYMALLIIIFISSFTAISYAMHKSYGGAWGSVYCSFINVMFVFVIVKAFLKQYKCYTSVHPKVKQ